MSWDFAIARLKNIYYKLYIIKECYILCKNVIYYIKFVLALIMDKTILCSQALMKHLC